MLQRRPGHDLLIEKAELPAHVRRYRGRAAPGEYLKSRVRFLESHMKVFGVAIVGAIALAVAAAIGLSFVQKTVAQAYSTGADRLDQQESVDFYGR